MAGNSCMLASLLCCTRNESLCLSVFSLLWIYFSKFRLLLLHCWPQNHNGLFPPPPLVHTRGGSSRSSKRRMDGSNSRSSSFFFFLGDCNCFVLFFSPFLQRIYYNTYKAWRTHSIPDGSYVSSEVHAMLMNHYSMREFTAAAAAAREWPDALFLAVWPFIHFLLANYMWVCLRRD